MILSRNVQLLSDYFNICLQLLSYSVIVAHVNIFRVILETFKFITYCIINITLIIAEL